jgi:tetratricopeptide (TPR) repeat protein
LAKAEAHLTEALKLARDQDKQREVAGALTVLALLYRLTDDVDRAEPMYREATAIARELGDRASVAVGLLNLSIIAITRGAGDDALSMLREAATLAEETGSIPVIQSVLEVVGAHCAQRRDWERAALLFGAADAMAHASGFQRDAADAKFLRRFSDQSRSALGESSFTDLETRGRALQRDAALAEARAALVEASRLR